MPLRTPLVLALALAFAVAASAQEKSGPKLYRWVDKQGKVHYDDALPPEAVNQARTEYSAKSGEAVGSVARALTPEERAAQAAAAATAAQAAAVEAERKHQEDIMMASYATEMDMRRAYGERLALLRTTIESTDVSIHNLDGNLATLLSQASDVELDNRRVLDDRKAMIRDLHAEKLKQAALQRTRRADLKALDAEFGRMLTRFRLLKGAEGSASPPAPPVAPAAPASTGG